MNNIEPTTLTIELKHMELIPDSIQVQGTVKLVLRVAKNNQSTYGGCSSSRKFIFMVEETDEESQAVGEGQSYEFQQELGEVGVYHLQCLNYTKIRATIELTKKKEQPLPPETVEPKAPTIQLQNLAEVQEEEKEEQTRQMNELEESHTRSDYSEYEKILNDGEVRYDVLPNKVLKYFQEEFKLWKDFFQEEPEGGKEKDHSQREEKSSAGSLEFSEKETEKEESVVSRLRSHQEISDIHEEQLNHPKTMKKTNSEYCFNVERETQKTHMSSNSKKRPFYTTVSSPHQRTEQSEAETFLDWASTWSYSQGFEELVLRKRGDRHLVRQWFTYLQNKYKVTEFLYG